MSRGKVPNVLSRCHTKRRTGSRGCADPSFGLKQNFETKSKKSVLKDHQTVCAVSRGKVPNVLSHCHNKRTGSRGCAGPSFGMTPTLKKKDQIILKENFETKSKKSVSYHEKGGRGHACLSLFWYDNDSGY